MELTQLCLASHCSFYPSMVSFRVHQQLIQGVADITENTGMTGIVGRWFLLDCFKQINTLIVFHRLVQKRIDAEHEVIRLCSTEPTEVKDLPMMIPKDSARYHFFLYKHSHEGDYLQSTGEWIRIRIQTGLRRTSSDTVCIHLPLSCPFFHSFQSLSILCPATSVASRRGCCIPAAKIIWWTGWKAS